MNMNTTHFKQTLETMPLFNTNSPTYSTSTSNSTITCTDNFLNCDAGSTSEANSSANNLQNHIDNNCEEQKNGFETNKYKLSAEEINNNLQRLFNQMNPERNDEDLNLNVSKLINTSTTNLKMVRNTRSTRSAQQLWKHIKSIKECECGNTVAIINNMKHKDEQYQVYGIINEICSDYMTVMIPFNYARKEFIQRKMYNFEIRNKKYGSVYVIPNKTAH